MITQRKEGNAKIFRGASGAGMRTCRGSFLTSSLATSHAVGTIDVRRRTRPDAGRECHPRGRRIGIQAGVSDGRANIGVEMAPAFTHPRFKMRSDDSRQGYGD